jgi:hypothetical protein
MTIPQINDIFYHCKYFVQKDSHYIYKVIGLAGNAHADNYSDRWVVYIPVDDESDHLAEFGITSYIRPLEEFLELVEVEGCKMPRFTKANKTVGFEQ